MHINLLFDILQENNHINQNSPKNRVDYKIMEKAFIKGLRHVLSKKFQYRIVADRGFGNRRFFNLCQENNFEFVVRINSNLRVKDLENNQKKSTRI